MSDLKTFLTNHVRDSRRGRRDRRHKGFEVYNCTRVVRDEKVTVLLERMGYIVFEEFDLH